jgi:hypothetical protein
MAAYHTVRDLAEEHDIPEGDLRAMARNGAIDAEKVGNSWLISDEGRDELEEYLADADEAEADAEAEDEDVDDDTDDDGDEIDDDE